MSSPFDRPFIKKDEKEIDPSIIGEISVEDGASDSSSYGERPEAKPNFRTPIEQIKKGLNGINKRLDRATRAIGYAKKVLFKKMSNLDPSYFQTLTGTDGGITKEQAECIYNLAYGREIEYPPDDVYKDDHPAWLYPYERSTSVIDSMQNVTPLEFGFKFVILMVKIALVTIVHGTFGYLCWWIRPKWNKIAGIKVNIGKKLASVFGWLECFLVGLMKVKCKGVCNCTDVSREYYAPSEIAETDMDVFLQKLDNAHGFSTSVILNGVLITIGEDRESSNPDTSSGGLTIEGAENSNDVLNREALSIREFIFRYYKEGQKGRRSNKRTVYVNTAEDLVKSEISLWKIDSNSEAAKLAASLSETDSVSKALVDDKHSENLLTTEYLQEGNPDLNRYIRDKIYQSNQAEVEYQLSKIDAALSHIFSSVGLGCGDYTDCEDDIGIDLFSTLYIRCCSREGLQFLNKQDNECIKKWLEKNKRDIICPENDTYPACGDGATGLEEPPCPFDIDEARKVMERVSLDLGEPSGLPPKELARVDKEAEGFKILLGGLEADFTAQTNLRGFVERIDKWFSPKDNSGKEVREVVTTFMDEYNLQHYVRLYAALKNMMGYGTSISINGEAQLLDFMGIIKLINYWIRYDDSITNGLAGDNREFNNTNVILEDGDLDVYSKFMLGQANSKLQSLGYDSLGEYIELILSDEKLDNLKANSRRKVSPETPGMEDDEIVDPNDNNISTHFKYYGELFVEMIEDVMDAFISNPHSAPIIGNESAMDLIIWNERESVDKEAKALYDAIAKYYVMDGDSANKTRYRIENRFREEYPDLIMQKLRKEITNNKTRNRELKAEVEVEVASFFNDMFTFLLSQGIITETPVEGIHYNPEEDDEGFIMQAANWVDDSAKKIDELLRGFAEEGMGISYINKALKAIDEGVDFVELKSRQILADYIEPWMEIACCIIYALMFFSSIAKTVYNTFIMNIRNSSQETLDRLRANFNENGEYVVTSPASNLYQGMRDILESQGINTSNLNVTSPIGHRVDASAVFDGQRFGFTTDESLDPRTGRLLETNVTVTLRGEIVLEATELKDIAEYFNVEMDIAYEIVRQGKWEAGFDIYLIEVPDNSIYLEYAFQRTLFNFVGKYEYSLQMKFESQGLLELGLFLDFFIELLQMILTLDASELELIEGFTFPLTDMVGSLLTQLSNLLMQLIDLGLGPINSALSAAIRTNEWELLIANCPIAERIPEWYKDLIAKIKKMLDAKINGLAGNLKDITLWKKITLVRGRYQLMGNLIGYLQTFNKLYKASLDALSKGVDLKVGINLCFNTEAMEDVMKEAGMSVAFDSIQNSGQLVREVFDDNEIEDIDDLLNNYPNHLVDYAEDMFGLEVVDRIESDGRRRRIKDILDFALGKLEYVADDNYMRKLREALKTGEAVEMPNSVRYEVEEIGKQNRDILYALLHAKEGLNG